MKCQVGSVHFKVSTIKLKGMKKCPKTSGFAIKTTTIQTA
jgi:hypothetical protein